MFLFLGFGLRLGSNAGVQRRGGCWTDENYKIVKKMDDTMSLPITTLNSASLIAILVSAGNSGRSCCSGWWIGRS